MFTAGGEWPLLAGPFLIFHGLRTAAQELSDAAGEFAAGEKHAASTRVAQQAYVGADANDFPAVAAAGMGFAHLNLVAGIEFFVYGKHRP